MQTFPMATAGLVVIRSNRIGTHLNISLANSIGWRHRIGRARGLGTIQRTTGRFEMQRKLFQAILAATAAMGSLAFAQHSATGPAVEAKTAEQAFKNITQLKGTPADQLLPSMQ